MGRVTLGTRAMQHIPGSQETTGGQLLVQPGPLGETPVRRPLSSPAGCCVTDAEVKLVALAHTSASTGTSEGPHPSTLDSWMEGLTINALRPSWPLIWGGTLTPNSAAPTHRSIISLHRLPLPPSFATPETPHL